MSSRSGASGPKLKRLRKACCHLQRIQVQHSILHS